MILNEWHLALLTAYPAIMYCVFRLIVLRCLKRERKRQQELENKNRKEMAEFAQAVRLKYRAKNEKSQTSDCGAE